MKKWLLFLLSALFIISFVSNSQAGVEFENTGGGGSGDITDVWSDTSGGVDALTAAAGDTFSAAAADSSIPFKSGVVGSIPGTCTEGMTYWATDTDFLYVCTATNTWVRLDANLSVDDLITLSGVAAGAAHLGTFTGTTIADSQTVKAALQALETAVEGKQASDQQLTDLAGDTAVANCVQGYDGSSVHGCFTNITVARGEVDGHTNNTNLTAANVSNTVIHNVGQGANDVNLNLPTAAAGYDTILEVGEASSNYWRFTAAATDKIYLDQTAGADNGYINLATPAVGSRIRVYTFKNGAAYDWAADTIKGPWVAGTATIGTGPNIVDFGATFDGGGSAIAVNTAVYKYMPYTISKINEWAVHCDVDSGTTGIIISMYKDAYADDHLPHTTMCTSGSTPHTTDGAGAGGLNHKAAWDCDVTSIAGGDAIGFKVTTAPTSSTRCTLTISGTR